MRISDRRVRTVLAALAVVLPGRLRRAVHVHLLGHDIHPTATLGLAFVDVDRMVLGPRATISHLNAIRGLEELTLGEAAIIKNLNWVNGVRKDKDFFAGVDRRPALVMGYSARIMVMHFLDCCDLIEFEDQATMAGYWSLAMTHTFDHRTNRQSTIPIRIGAKTMVTTRCTLLPGADVPECSIVASGSTVTRKLDTPWTVYAGSPAKPVAEIDRGTEFFLNQPETVR